jgi:hypothetical protein
VLFAYECCDPRGGGRRHVASLWKRHHWRIVSRLHSCSTSCSYTQRENRHRLAIRAGCVDKSSAAKVPADRGAQPLPLRRQHLTATAGHLGHRCAHFQVSLASTSTTASAWRQHIMSQCVPHRGLYAAEPLSRSNLHGWSRCASHGRSVWSWCASLSARSTTRRSLPHAYHHHKPLFIRHTRNPLHCPLPALQPPLASRLGDQSPREQHVQPQHPKHTAVLAPAPALSCQAGSLVITPPLLCLPGAHALTLMSLALRGLHDGQASAWQQMAGRPLSQHTMFRIKEAGKAAHQGRRVD